MGPRYAGRQAGKNRPSAPGLEVVFSTLADASLADLLDEEQRLAENCGELRSRPNAAIRGDRRRAVWHHWKHLALSHSP